MKKGYIVAAIIAISALGISQFENSKTISDFQNKIEYLEEKNNTQTSYNVFKNFELEENLVNSIEVNNKEILEEEKAEPVETISQYVPVVATSLNNNTSTSVVKSLNMGNSVYTTNTGSKYHREGCRYLKYSSTEISMVQAISMGLTPCKVCKP